MPRTGLTAREWVVVRRVEEGESNAQIATALGISVATVERHPHSVMIKWGAQNRTQVAVWAARKQRTGAGPLAPGATHTRRPPVTSPPATGGPSVR